MTRERCEAVMNIYLSEVLGNRQFDRIKDIAATDMIDHTQPGLKGPEALDAHARGFCINTPDVEIEVVRVFATADTAVGIWRWHGDPKTPSAVSAKGSPVSPRLICSLFEVDDAGMIRDYRVFVDAADVFTQLMQ